MVWFPTRGLNKLDLVYTNINRYVNAPQPTQAKSNYTTVSKRFITEEAKIGISNDIGVQ